MFDTSAVKMLTLIKSGDLTVFHIYMLKAGNPHRYYSWFYLKNLLFGDGNVTKISLFKYKGIV